MRENMTFLTNYYQIREMTIDRMKEIIDQNQIEYKSMYRIFKEDGKKQVEEIN